jgi:hypothetical protein
MYKWMTMVALAVAIFACGGSEESSDSTTTVGDPVGPDVQTSGGTDDPDPPVPTGPPGSDCDVYTTGDPCIDEAALEACRARSSECPDQVQVLESCPLQFACP